MGTHIGSGRDVVSFLKDQHQQVKALFNRVTRSHGDDRAKAFVELRRLLAVHETAEEEIVHPMARHTLPNGDAVVDARLREENLAKQALSQLEEMTPDSFEFESKFGAFERDVLAHATAEEREEFDRLGAELEPDRLERMRKAAEFAESVAPTRPHPGVESATANALVGPFAAMLDRARDALSR